MNAKEMFEELVYTTIEEELKDEAYTDYENLLYNRDYLLKQNTKLQSQIDEVKEYLNQLSTEEQLLEMGFVKMYTDGMVFAYENIKEDINEILSKLEEVGK